MEVWKAIEGYEGKYSISNYGRVRNDKSGRVSYGRDTGHGYRKVTFYSDNTAVGTQYVHRLVARAFLPCGGVMAEVNHKDGNRSNNCADNLEWVTSSGNTEHAVESGSLVPWNNARKPIIAIDLATGERTYFKSISIAERHFDSRHICQVLKGKRRQVKGHTFVYAKGGDADAV